MFRVVEHLDVDWPVEVPWSEDGADVQARFTARFRLLPAARVQELQEAAARATTAAEGDRDYFAAILVGWSGVADADGRPLPFDDTSRDRLVGLPRVGLALALAYGQALRGIKRGN